MNFYYRNNSVDVDGFDQTWKKKWNKTPPMSIFANQFAVWAVHLERVGVAPDGTRRVASRQSRHVVVSCLGEFLFFTRLEKSKWILARDACSPGWISLGIFEEHHDWRRGAHPIARDDWPTMTNLASSWRWLGAPPRLRWRWRWRWRSAESHLP